MIECRLERERNCSCWCRALRRECPHELFWHSRGTEAVFQNATSSRACSPTKWRDRLVWELFDRPNINKYNLKTKSYKNLLTMGGLRWSSSANAQLAVVIDEAFSHRRRQERYLETLDKRPNLVLGLRVGRLFAHDYQRTLGRFDRIEYRFDLLGRCVRSWRILANFYRTREGFFFFFFNFIN